MRPLGPEVRSGRMLLRSASVSCAVDVDIARLPCRVGGCITDLASDRYCQSVARSDTGGSSLRSGSKTWRQPLLATSSF
jgi:hypothetical protein